MTPERRSALAHVVEALPDLDRPMLVVVDGGDGSGKTWFADDLAALLGGTGRAVGPCVGRRLPPPAGPPARARADRRDRVDSLVRLPGPAPRPPGPVGPRRRDVVPPSPSRPRHRHAARRAGGRGARRTACWSSTASSRSARSCATAGTWWCGSRCRTRNGYAGWPRATASPETRPPGSAPVPRRAAALPRRRRPGPRRRPGGRQHRSRRDRSSSARPVVPPGWHRTPHGLRRVVTTDAETAARINRLLGE